MHGGGICTKRVCVGLWGKVIPEVVPLVSVRNLVHHEIKG
jgi:hypothetical protein